MIKNVCDINDLRFGGKAYGLNKLNKYGVRVPKAYAIDNTFIKGVLNNNEETIGELKKALNTFSADTKFAVRSSALNEDGNDKSFAGMYESVLDVPNDVDSILKAIKKVSDSSISARIESYDKEKSKMCIVLQQMVYPKVAGVCFTDSIDLYGNDAIYIEYVHGLGESLVSGRETAKSVVVSLNDFSYVCEDEEDRDLFRDLVENLKEIRNITTEPLDMEWCITDNGDAYFVQARPITKRVIVRSKLSTGAVASSGYCEGKIYIIDEDADDEEIEQRIDNFMEGCVLLAKTTDTNYVPAMKKASGIITTEGSVLSHAAIIAREFQIPCITGYKNAFNLFEEGKDIIIDTNLQSIIYDGKKICFGNGKEINLLELYNFENIVEETIDGNIVLVEKCDDEFGIHIDEDLTQEEIDNIVIEIRKKYKKDPIVLSDQKYIWYTEFKRFQKFPGYKEKCQEAYKICCDFDVDKLEIFVNNLLDELKNAYASCTSDYDKIYFGEYAQAIHFLINLYMCNGCAMKGIYEYIKANNISSVNDLLKQNNIQSKFLSKIEKIRESIWGTFVKNGWSNDDYFDNRENNIAYALNLNDSDEDVVDKFYENIDIHNLKKTLK